MLLNGGALAVYLRPVPEKEYHLALVLSPNGGAKIQGLALQAHQVEEIGKIPPQYVAQMQNDLRWDRDLLVFHCYRYEDARRIPPMTSDETAPAHAIPHAPTAASDSPASARQEEPAATTQNGLPARRGQRLQVKFGANSWDAVYWGKDAQGHVVAHQTYQKWSLMHLDLERFSNGLLVDPNVDEALLSEIERSLLEE